MAEPYIGEIRIFAGTFAPQGWSTCDGQLLAISDYETLFNLIGTTYGGDGQTTFALPNLAARVPLHMGTGASTYQLGQTGGAASVTLTVPQMPSHSHSVVGDAGGATTASPSGAVYANATPKTPYSVPNAATNPRAATPRSMSPTMLSMQGGGQPHNNLQPSLALTYIISLFGIFPSQN